MKHWLDIKLMREDTPIQVMSNSEEEWKTNQEFIKHAKGDVLMIGLGIGYVLPFILKKIDSIDIVEINKEVIELAYEWFYPVHNPKVNIILGDGRTFEPTKEYDTIFWDTFGLSDEVGIEQVERLKKWLKPNGWAGRWRNEDPINMA